MGNGSFQRERQRFMEREAGPGEAMTSEFEALKHDPDLQAEPGPGGTLIFLDGDQYCVVGPDFVGMEDGEHYAFGATREEAIANYGLRNDLR